MAAPTEKDSTELSQLEHYAKATRTKVLTSTADIDLKDHVLSEMYAWCQQHSGIVVLKSGSILTSNPISRDVQNCKSVLLSKGIPPGRVYAATKSLITMLLADSQGMQLSGNGRQLAEISDRQQHLRNLVEEAIARHASDIHIEVRETHARVKIRQHGELKLFAEWSQQLGREIAAVAFNKETDHATSHFNPYIPQDASMPLTLQGGRKVRLRLASLPAHGGFDMVLRILTTSQDTAVPQLTELGYSADQASLISNAIKQPHGAIIVAGPTGSGKTTTLASCMTQIENSRKVYSIEDPVEKVVETATQVPVNTEKEDRSFASMGRASLRMDPDVIILGEMRDEDTTRVMCRAAITGHLVLTTVHASSATGIVTRLLDFGISPILLSDNNLLRLLVFQRLVTRLCDHCKKPIQESELAQSTYWKKILEEDFSKAYVRNSGGCDHCEQSGITGRIVVAEVIWMDEQGREFIRMQDMIAWERYLRAQGWKSYQDSALNLIKMGYCDPEEVESTIGMLMGSANRNGFDYRNVAQ